jgi:type IV secretion system protein VirB8
MKVEAPLTSRQAYYAQAETWAQDIHGSLRASRRVAWIVAGCACVVAVAEGLALAALAPLKTVVPYTLTVDRQTGFVETASGLKPGPLSQDVAVTDAFLAQYVLARETFDMTDLQANYRKVALWTAGPAHDAYIREMSADNPASPIKTNPPGTVVQTTIKSISLLSRTSALVRFQTERHDSGGPGLIQPYAAVVSFRYTGAPMRMEDRFVNPLGFEVTSYRRDAETAAPVPAPPPILGGAPAGTSAVGIPVTPQTAALPPPAAPIIGGNVVTSAGPGR